MSPDDVVRQPDRWRLRMANAGVVYRRGVIFTLGILIGVTAACGEERLSPWAFFGTAVLWPVALGYALVTADFSDDDPPPICHAPTAADRP